MVNGSLEEWLHSDHDQRHLNLIQRVDIAIDVANALDYLHNHSHTTIVHCDLKPTNVLLDDNMIARVGDFGLARLLPNASHPFSSDQTSTIGIRGSIGYVAPGKFDLHIRLLLLVILFYFILLMTYLLSLSLFFFFTIQF